MKVLKFGGTSVGSAERMRGVASQMLLPDMEDEQQINFEIFLF